MIATYYDTVESVSPSIVRPPAFKGYFHKAVYLYFYLNISWSDIPLRTRLHQASTSTLRQLCDDASDTVLIENNGVTSDWGCNYIVFNENSIPSVITQLLQRWCWRLV